jgi:hypothetical protein
MANNPVQVILNTRDFFVVPESNGFPKLKDFFEDRDQEFVQHRDRLLHQAIFIGTAFQQSGLSSGVLKVTLRKEAWAKSHRPQRALFPPGTRPCIAVSKLGELYYHVTREGISELEREISAAEPETRRRTSRTGHEYVAPSKQRSDVGAVETISLPAASEKRHFSVSDALRWLEDPRTAGAYLVEFFAPPPAQPMLPAILAQYFDRVVESLAQSFRSADLYVHTFPIDRTGSSRNRNVYGFRLKRSERDVRFNGLSESHGRLLTILDKHPYVRSVALPPIIVAARMAASAAGAAPDSALPVKSPGRVYPKVGIIDGGMPPQFGSWTLGSHLLVAPEHQSFGHASFIAGLLVGGQKANGNLVCKENDGCDLFDIAVLPDPDQPRSYSTYYPNGIRDFIAELDAGVEIAKRNHGVRVFNMSLNILEAVQSDSYGIVASLIDDIADRHGVLFVISAGNLAPNECRSEWTQDANAVLQHLATRTTEDTVLQPAESSRSVTVGALNPPGCVQRVEGAPAAYSRRGPGLRIGVKPDVAHFGGALPTTAGQSGLKSWAPNGLLVHGQGTSYAAPQVAKTLATLDSLVQSPLSRETLVAMLIHNCRLPNSLQDPSLREVVRQFVGFGIPSAADEMLITSDHAITMVFSDVLQRHRQLQFDFAWPRCLVTAATGACRGDVRMTVVYRPPLDRNFGTEFVRVNVDGALQQEHKGGFKGRLDQAFMAASSDEAQFEHELIRHGLKWWPTKFYTGHFARGVGRSSNWRLTLDHIVRAEERFPVSGIPFSLLLTISDPRSNEPVFNDLRLYLSNRNVQLADIRATTQIRVQS